MAIAYNPRIVTDGLVLCLDAANPKSYPGSGTTWTDISGNGNHATLVSSPTFVDNSFLFNGSTQYATISANSNTILDSNFSIIIFCKPTSALTGSTDIRQTLYSGNTSDSFGLELGNFTNACAAGGQGTTGYRFLMHRQGNCFTNITNTDQFIQNEVFSFVFTRNASRSGIMYKNKNVLSSLNNENWTFSTPSSINIARRASTSSQYFNGNIYSIMIYNRVISQQEVTQLYEAYRGRYGI